VVEKDAPEGSPAPRRGIEICVFAEPQQGATYDQQLAVAQVAEECGFQGYFRTDHLQHEGSVDGLPGPTDAWTTLAGLARETANIRLGTLMCCSSFRYPGHLAIIVAQVDAMSGGRVELGLGAASFPGEHHALGIPLPDVPERFERLAEQFDLITGLWATPLGELYSFHGRYFDITEYPALVRPAQVPRPPIIVGGHGLKRTPAVAARFADEYNIDGVSPAVCAEAYSRVYRACEEIGRDPAQITCSAAVTLCCGADTAEIKRRAEAITSAVAGWKNPAEIIQDGAAGTPGQVLERLQAFKDAGARRVYLQLFDLADLDHLRLVAEEVLSKLA
jgi:F420-dependent oxidoreductase-like protein